MNIIIALGVLVVLTAIAIRGTLVTRKRRKSNWEYEENPNGDFL